MAVSKEGGQMPFIKIAVWFLGSWMLRYWKKVRAVCCPEQTMCFPRSTGRQAMQLPGKQALLLAAR